MLTTRSTIAATILLTGSLQASDDLYSFGFKIGEGNNDIKAYQLTLRKDITQWCHDNGLPKEIANRPLKGYLDASVFHWNSDINNLYGGSITPTVSYEFAKWGKFTSYLEVSLGIAVLSENQIGIRSLGTYAHFRTSVGIGLRSETIDYYISAEHFSNANIKKPNEGLTVYSAGIRFEF